MTWEDGVFVWALSNCTMQYLMEEMVCVGEVKLVLVVVGSTGSQVELKSAVRADSLM